MRNFILLLLLLPICVFAQSGGYEIDGNISGIPDGTIVKIINANDNGDLATAKTVKGNFVIKGTVPEPSLCKIAIGSEPQQYLYLENKKITIVGSKSDLAHLKVTGSAVHQDFVQFQQVFNPLIVSLNNTVNQLNKTTGKPQYDALMSVYDSTKAGVQKEIDRFIKAKPKSVVSAFTLLVTAEMYDDPLLLEKRYNSLDTSVKNYTISKNLNSFIQYNKVGAVGTAAMDFTQPDTTGKPVTLSSFKGKYVLVDFWASWCGPCRAENPNVVENYNKFRTKNFTVLGVTLDRPGGKDNWLAAIRKDKLTWTHVGDLSPSNAAAQLYRVGSIPYNILIDPTGKIIAKNLRGEMLQTKLCEVLGCN